MKFMCTHAYDRTIFLRFRFLVQMHMKSVKFICCWSGWTLSLYLGVPLTFALFSAYLLQWLHSLYTAGENTFHQFRGEACNFHAMVACYTGKCNRSISAYDLEVKQNWESNFFVVGINLRARSRLNVRPAGLAGRTLLLLSIRLLCSIWPECSGSMVRLGRKFVTPYSGCEVFLGLNR